MTLSLVGTKRGPLPRRVRALRFGRPAEVSDFRNNRLRRLLLDLLAYLAQALGQKHGHAKIETSST